MKKLQFIHLGTVLLSALSLPASAIEAPADDAPPPASAKPANAATPQDTAKPAEAPDAAFLGVVTQQVPKLLSKHLKLKDGEGVVVQAVSPDGPAQKAGIQASDIITAMDGNLVGTSADLTRLVSGMAPGKTTRIQCIQQGQRAEIDVTLGIRPKGLAGMHRQPLDELKLDGVPPELADRVRGMIEGNLGGVEMPGLEGEAIPPQMDDAMRAMRERMEKALQDVPQAGAEGVQGNFNIKGESMMRMLEPDGGSIELKSSQNGKDVTVRDKDNNVTWTGPWESEQDKAAAPADVRKRLEKLKIQTNIQGNGLRLQLDDGCGDPVDPPTEE